MVDNQVLADDESPRRWKIAVDFDGTIVEHRYPDIGPPVPGALAWLKAWQDRGVSLILFTMRSGPHLTEAEEYLCRRGIRLFGVNIDPEQSGWTDSPKAYAHIYIDDAAFGCPLRESPTMGARPYVNWEIVGPAIMKRIEKEER